MSLLALISILAITIFIRVQLANGRGKESGPLALGTVVQSVYGIGNVTANNSFQLTPGVTGTVSFLFVKEGDFVKRGEKLLKLDSVTYRAPFDGTITSLPNKPGENVFNAVSVLTLVDMVSRYIVVSLEQQGALRIQKGQQAILNFDSMRGTIYHGEVTSVYSNPSGYLARIDLAELPKKILPFMTADVAITLSTHENVLLVPVSAIEEGKYVWVKSLIPKRIEVKLGIVDKEMAEVLSGDLHPGDIVITKSQASQ